jgi:hypothetical protein
MMCSLFTDHMGMLGFLEYLLGDFPSDEACHLGEALLGEKEEETPRGEDETT